MNDENRLMKKQRYGKENVHSAIGMAWPAIVESFLRLLRDWWIL